jgi:hypothetical protein
LKAWLWLSPSCCLGQIVGLSSRTFSSCRVRFDLPTSSPPRCPTAKRSRLSNTEGSVGNLRNKFAKQERRRRVAAVQAAMRPPPRPPFVPRWDLCSLEGFYNPMPRGGFILFYEITGGHNRAAVLLCEVCAAPKL